MTEPALEADIASVIDQLAADGVELWFEGNRLRFRGPPGALSGEQRLVLASRRDEVIAVLRERAAGLARVAPMSYGQRSLWFVHQERPASAAYNIAFVVSVASIVDRDALVHSLQALVDRHAILRTTYGFVDGRPSQRIAGTAAAAVEFADVAGVDDAELARRVDAANRKPFDLERGPVLRTTLFTRTDTDHVLLISAHHIAVDGWSMLLLLDELRQLYPEHLGGKPAGLARPEFQYADYAAWQAGMLAAPEGAALAGYWEKQLAGPRAQIDIPADRPRPPRKTGVGATYDFRIDAELATRLGQLARAENTTVFVLALAAYKVLLFRYSGVEDVIVGTPTLGRNKGEFNRTIGHFVNPVPLRSRVTASVPFRDLMRQVRRTLLEALDNQEYPLATMVERLHPVRDPSRSPLFETIFVLQRFEQFRELNELLVPDDAGSLVDFGGLQVRPFVMPQQEGQFDIAIGLVERETGMTGAVKYDPALFDEATIARFATHYTNLLRSIVDDPATAVGRLGLLSPAERAALVAPGVAPDAATPMHPRFEAQAARTPLAVAVTCGDRSLTYRELNDRANRLAHRLRALGVGPDTIVGLCAERSLDLVVGVLGILKAGGAYLPVDLAYPAERVAFMLSDAGAPVVVTQRSLVAKLPGHSGTTVCLDDPALSAQPTTNPTSGAGADNLIYVIYTSGSTGQPKGTLLTHRAVDRLLRRTAHWFEFGPTDVWTLFHSVAFDFSVWELWGALANGGRLVVVPFLVSRSPEQFLDLVRREGVTVLNQTPSAFRQLIQADIGSGPPRPTALRHVIFGGEALELQSLRPWFERYGDTTPRLVNMYGITETCVHVTYRPLRAADLDSGRGSVIGVPIPDLTVDILDQAGQPVPAGVVGEMFVGGAGLAKGYLNRPELTADRFVPDPVRPGGRLYRTGDLARRLADGDIEYFGRADQQVKIRGFRIELGEIEASLGRHPMIRQAAVVAVDGPAGAKQLIAYLAADRGTRLEPAALRDHLRVTLPDYMVPAHFVQLDTLPLTPNGKVDVKALPTAATVAAPEDDTRARLPRSSLEMQLLILWRRALENDRLGIHDDFFEAGGHSLIAAELLSRVEQVFGKKLPLATLFQAPAVAQLAEVLERDDWTPTWRSLVAIEPNGSAVPLYLVPGVGGNVLMFGLLSKLLGPDQPLYGLQARGLDRKEEPLKSIPEMARHYVAEIKTVQPEGPYFIGGSCTGGVIAFEMAQQLAAAGDDVRLVILESWAPSTLRMSQTPRGPLWPVTFIRRKLVAYGRELAHLPVRTWPGYVRRKLRAARVVLGPAPDQELKIGSYHVEKVVQATLQAVARYEPQPYPGALLNVIAINRPLPPGAVDTRRTWEALAAGGAQTVLVPAEDSGRLFVSPHAEVVAEVLKRHAAEQFADQAPVAPPAGP